MPTINLLSREISELIAAGEVIERPSSVIKELIENSIDAGSRHITVEIKRGGSTFIRITDDGCGIAFDDVPKAFLRHATSKITTKDDLNSILTLGFRGEALASVCAVSKTEIITKQAEDELGTHYIIEGSDEVLHERTGCPDGTTIIIRDLFYNVPARQKFMKKDSVEGNMVCGIVNKIALSHPEIAFKLLRDNKLEFSTSGDGKLYSAVFAVYGKAFAGDMIPVEYEQDGIKIHGFTVKPLYSRANRTFQNFFVNSRYVKSQVCASALEEAYKGTVMTGKFPACILMIDIAPDVVDVNVHPAKVEIRFSDDRPVYDCMFFAVKSALMKAGLVYDFQLKQQTIAETSQETYIQPKLPETAPKQEKQDTIPEVPETEKNQGRFAEKNIALTTQSSPVVSYSSPAPVKAPEVPETKEPAEETTYTSLPPCTEDKYRTEGNTASENYIREIRKEIKEETETENTDNSSDNSSEVFPEEDSLTSKYSFINSNDLKKKDPEVTPDPVLEKPKLKYIGEAFKGYIIAEAEEKIIIMDKHAAHERIIFEKLKSEDRDPASQLVLCPEGVLLSLDEAHALEENTKVLENMGFKLDFANSPYISVKAIPTIIAHLNMDEIIPELADNFRKNMRDPRPEAIDDILHTIACKAAIKMNDSNNDTELSKLAEEVYFNDRIRHCPHGRPVMFVISKYELEKQFRRKV